jgi:hypothetical protein
MAISPRFSASSFFIATESVACGTQKSPRRYNDDVKRFALFLCVAALLLAEDRPGNFAIRFEPTARLQTDAEIPFHVRVNDDLSKPLVDAKVTLTIETAQHDHVKVYKASAIEEGVYVAKPMFPVPGAWQVQVDVRRDDLVSSKTEEYNVPKSTEP